MTNLLLIWEGILIFYENILAMGMLICEQGSWNSSVDNVWILSEAVLKVKIIEQGTSNNFLFCVLDFYLPLSKQIASPCGTEYYVRTITIHLLIEHLSASVIEFKSPLLQISSERNLAHF